MNGNVNLTAEQVSYILTPQAIRDRAAQIFALTENGRGEFVFHADKLNSTVSYVLSVIRKNYPDLKIPFHSRWGHFQVGAIDRVSDINRRLSSLDPFEKARSKLDLVITSVLLDAGAGADWKYQESSSGQCFSRSEGLGVASWHMFLSGAMSEDHKSLRADAAGLSGLQARDIESAFQVTTKNPLIGVTGRALLLNNLGRALSNREIFKDGRPGNIIDFVVQRYGRKVPAKGLLLAVFEGFGPIWPGRLSANGKNLGDVWRYSKLKGPAEIDSLVPLHKLSQWMTYSLIEPIVEAGCEVVGVHELTGLAEYRNGGLLIDADLISFRDPGVAKVAWRPESDLVIEWRALTVHLLDIIGESVRKQLGFSSEEFPLAKVLEGGTWWAGRFLAKEKRLGGTPPLQIESDGTVF